MTTIQIRSEQPADYAGIANVHTQAFQYKTYTGEAVLVDMLRRRPRFDPELSLLAEEEGRILAHGLFSPCTLRFTGEETPAVFLAPLGVHPSYQKAGIGGRILAEGLRRAKEKGYALCFLLGHPTYYPRFGFQTGLFGTSRVHVTVPASPPTAAGLEERRARESDIPLLLEMWSNWYGRHDFAIRPEANLAEWSSVTPKFSFSVFCQDQAVIGFAKYQTQDPSAITMLLARDQAAAAAILSTIQLRTGAKEECKLRLDLHPNAAKDLLPFPFESVQETWEPAMAIDLDGRGCSPAADFIRKAAAGDHFAGPLIWPVEFDLMD